MRIILGFCALLIVSSTQAAGEEIIKDKSPDGKFALRMTKQDAGWYAAVIDLKDREGVVELDVYQNQADSFIKQGRLVWSKDSQRVAYFEPDRRGGSMTVYFRNGSAFEQIQLPDIPECQVPAAKDGDEFVKDVENTTKPAKWLPSGELVLATHRERITESGATRGCGQKITIAFGADHKASVKSVKQDND